MENEKETMKKEQPNPWEAAANYLRQLADWIEAQGSVTTADDDGSNPSGPPPPPPGGGKP